MVPGRSESGQWVRWRVGRRRLAWVPRMWAVRLMEFADGQMDLVVAAPVLALVLGEWLCPVLAAARREWLRARVAMAVVWPARAFTGRWPVVAYRLAGPGADRLLPLR